MQYSNLHTILYKHTQTERAREKESDVTAHTHTCTCKAKRTNEVEKINLIDTHNGMCMQHTVNFKSA